MAAVPEPDLEIRGEGPGHPDPEIRRGAGLQKIFLRPIAPQFGLKVRGGHLDPRLSWYRTKERQGMGHLTCSYMENI